MGRLLDGLPENNEIAVRCEDHQLALSIGLIYGTVDVANR